jgi:hypothetical protein
MTEEIDPLGRRLFHLTGPVSVILSFFDQLEVLKLQAVDKTTYERII